MFFTRHIGADKRFTIGKVYPARPELDTADAVSSKFIEIRADNGENVRLESRQEIGDDGKVSNIFTDFEFVEEVYAVIAKPFDDLKVGQVVVVDDVESFSGAKKDGGRWDRLVYNLKGLGYRSSDWVVLLDRTNVFPGMMVMEEATGNWVKVKSVDECLWVVTDDKPGRRSPEEFRFAVDRDGDIMVEPLVECVDAEGQPGLSRGTRYYVIREEGSGDDRLLWVVNDAGLETRYMAGRFRA